MLQVLPGRFQGDALVPEVVVCGLQLVSFGLDAGQIGLGARGLGFDLGRFLVELPAAVIELAIESLDFGPLSGQGRFLSVMALNRGVDLRLPFGQRRVASFDLRVALVDRLLPELDVRPAHGRLLGVPGELLRFFPVRLALLLELFFLDEKFLLARSQLVLLRAELGLFLLDPLGRLAEVGGSLVGFLAPDQECRPLLFELRLLRPQMVFALRELGGKLILLCNLGLHSLAIGLEAFPLLLDRSLPLLDLRLNARAFGGLPVQLLALPDQFRLLCLKVLDLGQELFAFRSQPRPFRLDLALFPLELELAVEQLGGSHGGLSVACASSAFQLEPRCVAFDFGPTPLELVVDGIQRRTIGFEGLALLLQFGFHRRERVVLLAQ